MDAAKLSRRSAFGLAAVTGLSACTVFPEHAITDDPYLPMMQKDPLYLWTPSAKSKRSEGYMASTDHLAGNAQSNFTIGWTFEDGGALTAMFAEAQSVAREAGYVDDRRRLMTSGSSEVYVRCQILSVIKDGEVIVSLSAPM